MKQKNFLKILFLTLITLIATPCLKAQTLTAGDLAIIGVGVDSEEVLLVALADIPSGESVFFTDDEWAGSAFKSGEGFYEWVTPTITAGNTITLTKTTSSVGGTVSQRAGSFALGNSGDGFFIYQTSTNVFNTGTYTILGFAGEDSGDAGTLTGTGLVIGEDAVYFAGDNGIYSDARTANSKSGHLANIYDNSKWTTSGTAQTFDTSNFTVGSATAGITLGAISGNTKEDGTTATFTAVLNLQPDTDVVLNISSGDTGEVTLDLATLTFTNADWDTPQTVTATGVDDALQDGSIVVTITVAVDDASSDDDYDAVVDVTTTVTNEDDELADLIINEFQADPDATSGDANGDGSVSTSEDEFIEVYNASGAEIDITNYTIEDSSGLRHTFPKGTILPAGAVIVVFGGGTPTGIPCLTQIASATYLGLNNSGDSITIKDASSTVVTTYTYGSEGGDNQSLARDTDLTGAFVKHSTITGNAVLFSPGRKNADNIPFSKTWTGTTDSVWTTTTNWDSNSNPSTSTDNVWIPSGLTNYPTSAAAVTVNSVTIISGATLKAEDAFTGSVTYNRSLATTNWYLMSSPVSGETIQDIIANHTLATSGVNYGLAPYDNSEALATNRWDYQVAASSGTLTNGKGYSVKLDATGDISFTGTINATDVSIALTQGAGGGGTDFNFVGNPFTTFINSGTFLTEEGVATTDITSATLWLWNQATSTYVTKVAGDSFKIAPGQGFFVEANSTNNVTFTEAMQSHEATDTFQRSSKTEVHLFVNDGNDSKFLKVYYINGTTKGFDNGYDGEMFRGVSHPFALYSRLVSDSQGKNYQIQSLPNSDYENMVIPIGVNAAAGKEITFSADALDLPADIKVFLEDRLTNTFTRLDETNSEYKVTLSETLNGVGRFYMHTTESVMSTEDVILNSVRIYKTDSSTLKITGLPQGKTSFYLYNILGKEMMSTLFTSNGNKEISLSKLASGIYLAKMQTEKGAISKKIILE